VELEEHAFLPRAALDWGLQSLDLPKEPEDYLHGKVMDPGVTIYSSPDTGAKSLGHVQAGKDLAFYPDPALEGKGWLRHSSNGYVETSRVKLQTGSSFVGVANPSLPMGFIVRTVHLKDGTTLQRYAQVNVLYTLRASVMTTYGVLPRESVRWVTPIERPGEVPAGVKWVYVDLDEQVLTAYEGDRPVYATLVSTGKDDKPSHAGLYRVWLKTRHDRMHGEGYDVEEVPSIMYFHGGEALHGAFWHDRFGFRVTHGCINLSPTDATWLFNWAPPNLPRGWHARTPQDEDESLYVLVGHSHGHGRVAALGAAPQARLFLGAANP
jgi:hypothetical protein